MRGEKLIKVTKIVLDIMFFSGIVVLVSVPFTLKLAGEYYSPAIEEFYIPMVGVFGASGICGILIVAQLRQMMKTVIRQNCFVYANAESLEIMGGLSLVIAILFLIKMAFLPTPATLVIVITFFIASLFSGVLSCVFREAVRYKEENDLTI